MVGEDREQRPQGVADMPEQTRRSGRLPTGAAHQHDAHRCRKAELEQFALTVLELERLEHRQEVRRRAVLAFGLALALAFALAFVITFFITFFRR